MHLSITNAICILAFAATTASQSLNSSGINRCLDRQKVPYAISTSADWTQLIEPFNLRLNYTPAVVTLPTTSQQVSDGVTCAAAANLKVQPKGGGHSYASFSSGGQNGSVVVDMESFNNITIDQSEQAPLNH
jgi:hypothetical protein